MTFSLDLESKYSLYGYLQTVRLIKSFFDLGVPISAFTFLNFHHGHPDTVTDVKLDIMLEGLTYLTGDELYYACADPDNEDLPNDIQIALDNKKFNFDYETIFIKNNEMKEELLRNETKWHMKAYKDFSYVVISLDHYELSDILEEFLGVWS